MSARERKEGNEIRKWWLATSVELQGNESVLFEGDASHEIGPVSVFGRLFLTTDRLIWIRWRMGLPIGEKVIIISVGELNEFVGRPRLFVSSLVARTISQKELHFIPLGLYNRRDARRWVEAVTDVRRGAVTSSGESP